VIAPAFQRHDYSFKPTFAEMAPCGAGAGLAWAIDNVLEAYEEIAKLATNHGSGSSGARRQEWTTPPAAVPALRPAKIYCGTATNLPEIADESITAVVVDPPYFDNVMYSELADFFYVWLKRTQGHRRPEWFAAELSPRAEEAVANSARQQVSEKASQAAKVFYHQKMAEVFREIHRVLRPEGVLTVMFTHKKQEAWEALFESLIAAGFRITATWPVKTESDHSLHIAKKNAAQSTVLLVARKRLRAAGGERQVGHFTEPMRQEIRERVRQTAERLAREGLNPVDQLVGSFGSAMEVFSRYDEVRTDTGELVAVSDAINEAADAVMDWRIEKLAARGLEGVEPEGRFVVLWWDVLGAATVRFNEAKLLGHAVGKAVDELQDAGLVTRDGEKVTILSARERRRDKALSLDEQQEGEGGGLFGPAPKPKRGKRVRKADALKVHPNDAVFRTALDACHALALRYWEAGGGAPGIGAAKSLARQQNWGKDSKVAKLMEALVKVAPPAVRFDDGDAKSAAAKFPEFRAWHVLLKELFGIEPPKWEKEEELGELELFASSAFESPEGELESGDEEEQAEEDQGDDDEGEDRGDE
ncbi:MAG: hypothetical protein N2Z21_09255, partial [Candidatus Sumerlaeaceae bacterium]|nr:hypothetical protein [Candidatus Sumerlaeaceae bacterium]